MDTVGLDFPSFAMWEKNGVYLVVQEVIKLVLDPQVSSDDRITHASGHHEPLSVWNQAVSQ